MTSNTAPLLAVENLNVSLQAARGEVRALRDVSFTLASGQTLGIIGESGCGKSLTALAVMGLLPESAAVSGSIRLNGNELVGKPDSELCALRGASMAMIFQEPMTALNPLHPIWRQIAEPLQLHKKMNRAEAKSRALELLERVQLPRARQRLHAYPHELSGGQRQRVMIAIALACEPKLLIADEPTTALDVTIQKEVLALINQLIREDGMGLILISHDLGLMHDQVENVMVMYGGSVIESAPTNELFKRRAHPYTEGLFAARPRLGLPRGTRLATIPGSVPDLFDLPTGCAFAPRCAKVVDECLANKPFLATIKAQGISQTISQATSQVNKHSVRCPRWNIS